MPEAYVAKFDCKVVVEAGFINETLLNEEICEDEQSPYYHSKYIDCFCRPESHTGWIASLRFIHIS